MQAVLATVAAGAAGGLTAAVLNNVMTFQHAQLQK